MSLHPKYVTDADGRRTVILPAEEFDALLELLEDYRDARDLEAALETEGEFMPVDAFAEELRAEGKLR